MYSEVTHITTAPIDKFFDRCYHMVGVNIFGLAGFLILMFVPHEQVGVHYFAAILVTIAVVSKQMLIEAGKLNLSSS